MVEVSFTDARALIDLKLEEYRRLSGETSTRLAGLASLLGFLTAGLAFAIGTRKAGPILVVAVAVAAVIGIGYWIYQVRRLDEIASGLLRVEREINSLAADAYPGVDAGAGALSWQTKFCAKKPGRAARILMLFGIPTGRGRRLSR